MKLVKDILKSTHGWPIKYFYAGKGTILALHRVLPKGTSLRLRNDGLEITPEKLAALINYFKKRKYDFISIDEVKDRLLGKSKRRFVVFTFDDGYKDNLEYAYPILKSHKVPFTIYLTNGFLSRSRLIWWYGLEHVLLEKDEIDCSFLGRSISFKTNSMELKNEAFNEFRKLFLTQNAAGVDALSAVLFRDRLDIIQRYVDDNLLSIKTIKEMMHDDLTTFGAHTNNHLSLNRLNKKEFFLEVDQSRKDLEEKLGIKMNHFSYPFGTKNEVGPREFEWTKSLEFDTAVTGRPGNIQRGHLRYLHALPRLYVGPETSEKELDDFTSGFTPCITGIRNRILVD